MVRFSSMIKRFEQQGEKTGWTYIDVPAAAAQELLPGNKKSFRVKGELDNCPFSMVALLPMGGGDFIMALNASMRKAIKKSKGASLQVRMELDTSPVRPPGELMECLEDEPEALAYFRSLPKGHQNYFINWIKSAKTDGTKAKRIAASLDAFARHWNFGQMMRALKKERLG